MWARKFAADGWPPSQPLDQRRPTSAGGTPRASAASVAGTTSVSEE